MRKVGTVLHTLGSILIARLEKGVTAPKLLGSPVIVGKDITGTVSDVFGPVKKPYVSVRTSKRLNGSEASGLRGKAVYLGDRRGGKRERGKEKKRR
ncbi:MAG: H/ACA ribonucleoprotein complex subunit GAR1 [Candidatus Alkanophagales archaeon]